MSIRIFLKAHKDVPVRRFHPWVFSGAIHQIDGTPADGDIVTVHDRGGELLGTGHFHHGSIAVRLLEFGAADLSSPDFWKNKLANAFQVRQLLRLARSAQTNCYRLVHAEGDGLPGLVVDVYAGTAVVQCHSIGMHRQRDLIAAALTTFESFGIQAVYDKSGEALPPQYAATQTDGYLWQSGPTPEGPVECVENDVRFLVDWVTGQKTGFFLDQRDNRQLLATYAVGRSVLNTFCYTGGFSAYALKAGASEVHSVDVSAKAMAFTDRNCALNQPEGARHEGFTEDVLKFFKQTDRTYDLVVVDPPAFAKTLDKRHNAVQGYKRLNAAALEKVAPGGLLFTFSCSQVVDRELFYNTLVAAALETRRPVRVLHHLNQGPDHPVSLFHPEGGYLKGLVLEVS